MKSTLTTNNGIDHQHTINTWQTTQAPEPWKPSGSCCPRCHEELELIQPDANLCDALLAVCYECPAWYVIDGRDGTMTDLGLSGWLIKTSQVATSD